MEQLISLYERWLHVPRWQKWILILIFGFLLTALIYYFQIAPLKEELNRKNQEIESLTLTVNRLKIVEKRRQLLVKELENLNKQIEQIESRLPTGREDVSQIIKSITDADSGMVVKLIERQTEKRHRYYIEFPYKVELIGNYPDFIRWCERLSKANRIINFGDMKIESIYSLKRGWQGSQKHFIPKGSTIKATLKIKAFTLTE